MNWILLGVLILAFVITIGLGAVVMAILGLAVGWGLIAHVIMGDGNIDGRRDL